MLKTSAEVREKLVEALELDLVGPNNGHPYERELLPRSPRAWYLTGMLVPVDAKVEAREDPVGDFEIDDATRDAGGEDGGVPEKSSKKREFLPSSIGMSFLVPAHVDRVNVILEWGEYRYEVDGVVVEDEPSEESAYGSLRKGHEDGEREKEKAREGYRRKPCRASVFVDVAAPSSSKGAFAKGVEEVTVPGSDGLVIAKVIRDVDFEKVKSVPAGTRSVSLFLVNRRLPHEVHPYRSFVFQPLIAVECDSGFVAKPDPRGSQESDDIDDRIAALQYRDTYEYVSGHGIAAHARVEDGRCVRVETRWMPIATVERVEPSNLGNIEFRMDALGGIADAAAARSALGNLPEQYSTWIAKQGATAGLTSRQGDTLGDLVTAQRAVCARIKDGIELLATNADALEAFRIANRAMAAQSRRRLTYREGEGPEWRPFQLAFILMALRGIHDPTHDDRESVDLLFFPTGGGKTEAYLGLAAFTLVLRRLRKPSLESAGVTVLMRYTLRLLTLDQLSRASALICALELEREKATSALGEHRFEIGLWVGSAATPNRMGKKEKYGAPEGSALKRTLDYQYGKSKASPIPLESCPWCSTKFAKDSFRLEPNTREPQDLFVYCANPKCEFTGDRRLPVLGVDEPIYRRLPCFLISTVDKFAALPWTAEVGHLLGRANRYDASTGFSRDPKGGPIKVLPPELVIQDELHLISGPLGTIAGIYEGAVDALASREIGNKTVGPKIVASTATVRRAQSQIKALFNRPSTTIFPPPGPDRRNSFFAETRAVQDADGRMYVGVAAQGRSLKVIYLRALLALLSRGQALYRNSPVNPKNPADPYMTLVGYFNSLRELGGSRRIAEDEVTLKLKSPPRRRIEPEERMFEERSIQQDMLELTSRVSTDEVSVAKDRLSKPFSEIEKRVDLALATNMISVGLDITRLGLMVVLGQPKTSSEYIQATSRVGRDRGKPGLVVVLLNLHRPRDRSHYERFEGYHQSFYRSVEATSVTPGSPRARERALAPALVGLVRQAEDALNPQNSAQEVLLDRSRLDRYAILLAKRAQAAAPMGQEQELHDEVLRQAKRLLDDWYEIAKEAESKGIPLSYDLKRDGGDRLLRESLDPEQLKPPRRSFRAGRSMRDVEAPVDIYVKDLDA